MGFPESGQHSLGAVAAIRSLMHSHRVYSHKSDIRVAWICHCSNASHLRLLGVWVPVAASRDVAVPYSYSAVMSSPFGKPCNPLDTHTGAPIILTVGGNWELLAGTCSRIQQQQRCAAASVADSAPKVKMTAVAACDMLIITHDHNENNECVTTCDQALPVCRWIANVQRES